MKTLTSFFSTSLATIALFCSLPSHAIPKAAEHENAPVTVVPDVAKPKPSTKPLGKKTIAKHEAHPKVKGRIVSKSTTKPKNAKNRNTPK